MNLKRYEEALEPSRVCARHGSLAHRVRDGFSRQNASLKLTNFALVLKHLKKFDEMELALQEAIGLDPSNSKVAEIRRR
jgi:hypothetical protein